VRYQAAAKSKDSHGAVFLSHPRDNCRHSFDKQVTGFVRPFYSQGIKPFKHIEDVFTNTPRF
jgi:hypothetical protein